MKCLNPFAGMGAVPGVGEGKARTSDLPGKEKLRMLRSGSSMAKRDAGLAQIVGRHGDVHFVSYADPDEILAHLA